MTRVCHPSGDHQRLLEISWRENTTWLTSEVGRPQTTLMLPRLLERKLQQPLVGSSRDANGECSLWKNKDNSTPHQEQVTLASTSHLNLQLSICFLMSDEPSATDSGLL